MMSLGKNEVPKTDKKSTELNISYDSSPLKTVQSERNAIVESVLRILEHGVECLKISLLLPKVFENPLTLRQCLNGTKFEHLVEMVEIYLKKRVSTSNDEQSIVDPDHNLELIKIIDAFHQNYKVFYELPDWFDDIGYNESYLLESFVMLQRVTEVRLRRSAVDELNNEKKIHTLYHENEKLKKSIKDFRKKILKQGLNIRWKLAAKDALIKKLEEDLTFKKWDNHMRIQKEIASSSNHIKKVHATSVIKQRELEEELEKKKQVYQKLQAQNLAQEKAARNEKNKALLQLQALLKKYDQTIGDKMKENIELQAQYDALKQDFDKFMVYYRKEEAQYERIVVQKEEEDRQKQLMKMMRFMMNRAAIIIQRWWKKIRGLSKKGKKKGAKGKGRRK